MKKIGLISLLFIFLLSGQVYAIAVDELLSIEGFNFSAIDVAWSPDGAQLAVASGDGLVKLFDSTTGELLFTLEGHQREAVSVEFSHDGLWLASSDLAGAVKIWDVATGENLQTLATGLDFISVARWSPDDMWLGVAADRLSDPANPNPDDYQIQIWETATWTQAQTLQGHEFGTSDIQWSSDGAQLATAGLDGRLRVWEVATWSETALMGIAAPITGFTSLDWSPDGTKIVTAHFNDNLQIWDIASKTQILSLQGHRDFVGHVEWLGDLIASASGSPISDENDDTIRLWNATTGEMLVAVGAHENGVRMVTWSPDGTKLASGGDDNTVKIWSVK